MRKKISLMLLLVLLALTVSAQPPHHREEARRMTNGISRKVGGLSPGQFDRVMHINMQYVRHEIGPERRRHALRRVLTDRQWNRYMGRGPAPKGGPRHPGPRHRDRHPGPHHDYHRR